MIGRTKPKIEIPNLSLDSDIFWRKSPSNPTSDDIPAELYSLWLNTSTGEIFVYMGLQNGKAVWKGQHGTIIVPSTVSKFDFFDDGSAIALWQFDGNANDTGGNYDGVWQGAEQYDVGKFGQCAKFDGNSYINTNISNFPSTVTLSLWFKQGAIDTSTHHCLFCFSKDGKNTLNLWQYATDTKKKMYFDINGSAESLPKFYEDNTWHHLVVVSSGKVYVDGEKVLDIPSVDLSVVNKPLLIGADWDSDKDNPNDFASSGTYVDQLRIFNRVLTEDEVQQLYNEIG